MTYFVIRVLHLFWCKIIALKNMSNVFSGSSESKNFWNFSSLYKTQSEVNVIVAKINEFRKFEFSLKC
jgi:hypothetical protein